MASLKLNTVLNRWHDSVPHQLHNNGYFSEEHD
jgi:hypothetical protein